MPARGDLELLLPAFQLGVARVGFVHPVRYCNGGGGNSQGFPIENQVKSLAFMGFPHVPHNGQHPVAPDMAADMDVLGSADGDRAPPVSQEAGPRLWNSTR